ncbi:hydrogenase maturation protease [Streptomyces sp. JJ36]|uniref:hydrogenase maturation protease n=1 Tax=Streptomyces sp. JJ36 TaxID=2736645 RepID=UPI001F005C14|nr:hydrogenase maturation protease [Streptomyces sp. JJ36]
MAPPVPPAARDGDRRTRVLVAGIGNVFRSDDGFGVEVARRLLARGGLPAGVEVADIGVRGMHLAYRLLDGYAGLLLVDTVHRDGPPGTVYRIEHDLDTPGGGALDGHGMDPASVLGLLERLAAATGVERPVGRVLLVGCEPAVLDEGMGLSEPVAAAVEPALQAVDELLPTLLGAPVPHG